ncbi:MAG: hypothetical protein Fur0010_23200 [Bdellovibrio sp.]
MMRQLGSLLTLTLIINSCAYFAPAPQDRTYFYLTGKDVKPETTSDEIIKNIGRGISMAGGNYKVEAYPVTRELLLAQTRELARQRGFTQEEIDKINLTHEQEYLLQKTCFNFSYAVTNVEQTAYPQDWKIHFIDHGNDEYPMLWTEADLKKLPVKTKLMRQEGNLDRWLHQGILCTDQNFDLSKGFGLRITPKFVQWPFPASEKLLWEFDYIVVNEQGEEEMVKTQKQNYQPYRGW